MRSVLRKLLGDIEATPGRFAMMIIALALSAAASIAMLLAYSVLTREVSRNYLDINPAAAQLMMGKTEVFKNSDAIIQTLKNNPQVTQVEVGAHTYFQVQVSANHFVTALIFILPELQQITINKINLNAGDWPETGSIILERKALKVAQLKIGDEIQLKPITQFENLVENHELPTQDLKISGTTHDPALAPADTEDMIYGYISEATWQQMISQSSTQLARENYIKVRVQPEFMTRSAIENIAVDLVKKLQAIAPVHELRIPPPSMHPHQTQMISGLRMLLAFSALAMLLAAVLMATLFWGLLAQQVRQIGVMKTLGATRAQITWLYSILVLTISGLALFAGVILGIYAGHAIITTAADILNLEIIDNSMSLNVWIINLIFCLGLPLLLAYIPIRKSVNRSVYSALNDYGVTETFSANQKTFFTTKFLSRLFTPLLAIPPLGILLLRNLGRRRARLNFILSLLAIAGGVFLSSQNLLASWYGLIDQAESNRHYQLDINFAQPVNAEKLKAVLKKIENIKKFEAWNKYSATPTHDKGLRILQTYPDGGHGSLTLRATPANTDLISLSLLQGCWLDSKRPNELVLNQTAYQAFFPDKHLGDSISLFFQDKNVNFRLVGILQEGLAGANAYTTLNESTEVGLNGVRIQLTQTNTAAIDQSALVIQEVLKTNDIYASSAVTENHRKKSGMGHVVIMVVILVMIAIVMSIVAFFGLATVISTNVSERLREFAVMRVLGAKNLAIFSLVLNEALLIALLSYLLALPLMLLFSAIIVKILAAISMQPLNVVISFTALWVWLAVLLLGAALSSLMPALNAMRFMIKEVLAYQ